MARSLRAIVSAAALRTGKRYDGVRGISREFLTIARVLGRGAAEAKYSPSHTDFPQRFEQRRELWGHAANGERRQFHLEEHWFHKGGVVLKFAGIDSISGAEQLAGMEVQIPAEQRAELEEGAVYVSELTGCEVWVAADSGMRLLGRIQER